MNTKPQETEEPVRDITILVPTKIRAGATQCRYCTFLNYNGDHCNAYSKPLKRSKAGRAMRCKACLDNQRGRR